MGQKLKIAGWVSIGAVAGALTTVQLQAVARGGLAPLPLEELQQLANVFGMVKSEINCPAHFCPAPTPIFKELPRDKI